MIKKFSEMSLQTSIIDCKFLKHVLHRFAYLGSVIILIPVFLYFEMVIVIPTIFDEWSVGHIIHLFVTAFYLLNILGNFLYGTVSDTSVKQRLLNVQNKTDWTYCSVCELLRPPRSWHCDICEVCVLKRDHHCNFLACCVGYYNQRYFLGFVLYLFISMTHCFFLNIKYLGTIMSWNNGIVILKFIFPLINLLLNFNSELLLIILIDLNFVVAVFCGYLLYFHLLNMLKGQITPEIKFSDKVISYDQGWKCNLIEVLGINWYLTWISPFINSPLPGDGLEWNINVHKDE